METTSGARSARMSPTWSAGTSAATNAAATRSVAAYRPATQAANFLGSGEQPVDLRHQLRVGEGLGDVQVGARRRLAHLDLAALG